MPGFPINDNCANLVHTFWIVESILGDYLFRICWACIECVTSYEFSIFFFDYFRLILNRFYHRICNAGRKGNVLSFKATLLSKISVCRNLKFDKKERSLKMDVFYSIWWIFVGIVIKIPRIHLLNMIVA